MTTLADRSTLDAISWPILLSILVAILVFIVAHHVWRVMHDADQSRRRFNADPSDRPYDHERDGL